MDVYQIIGLVIAALGLAGGVVAWMFNVAWKLGELVGVSKAIAAELITHRETLGEHSEQLGDQQTRLTKLECRNPPPANQPRPSPA